ncbi:hypothetical protein L4174_022135 [Photobacterium sp. CCB-ST2H9]|nr:hypothetical protein [Photobacterium sp. CCB-ST2H9]UTM59401.1 hypothetical protein L4174_022135 [Photobacterium sp. CCB-ST2H9]
MNVDDFLLTAGISLLIGLVLGYFGRELTAKGIRVYRSHFRRSHYFEQD